jgi:ACS family D-galactonate transporter-like MFS transporter
LIIRLVVAVSAFFVPHVVNTVTTLVEHGPTAQALAVRYAPQLATAAKVDAATQAALAKNPNDSAAQVAALSEISGVSRADVTTVVTLSATDADALAAGQALDPATALGLITNPADPVLGAKAVGEVVAKLGVTPAQAQASLLRMAKIPAAQLVVVQQSGPKVQDAVAKLTALSTVPAADTTLLQEVQRASLDSPKQWQRYYWIAVGGEVLFVPLIFLMAGFWDPRKARRQAWEHERWVQAELTRLARGEPTGALS